MIYFLVNCSHRTASNVAYSKSQDTIQQFDAPEAATSEGSRDLMTNYTIANSETVVISGNDSMMNKRSSSYPPQFKGIPPPPAFRQKTKPSEIESNSNVL